MSEPAIARCHNFAVPLKDEEERPTMREAFAEFECRCEGRVGSKYLVKVVEEGASLFSRKNVRCLKCGGTVEEEKSRA